MKLNYYNICGMAVCAVLIFSTLVRKIHKGKLGKIYFMMLLSVFFSSAFDVVAVRLDNVTSELIPLKYFANIGYLFFHNLTGAMYSVYIIAITDSMHLVRNRRLLKTAYWIPLAAVAVLLVVNLFNGCLFTFDENGIYKRGEMFLVLYISTAFYIVFGMYYLFKYRKTVAFDRWIALMLVVPVSVFSAFIQLLFPEMIIEIFMNAISIMFVSTIVQRPEEFLDVETGARNETALISDTKRMFITGKPVDMILIKIINYQNMLDYISSEDVSAIMRKIVSFLYEKSESMKMKNTDIYFQKRGMICIISEAEYHDRISGYLNEVMEYLRNPIVVSEISLNCDVSVCSVRCPEDIDSFESINLFINNFIDKGSSADKLYEASDIINNRNYSIQLNIETIINKAIAENRFKVYYQPIYSVSEKRFVCAEALIRLYDDEYSFVSPELFIPAAEKNGSIHRIGKYVLEEVCRFISSEQFRKLSISFIDVNLSAVQCMNSNLTGEIQEILARYGVPPKSIVLEITETAASHEHNIMDENIKLLTDAGFDFSLDDFGTGYSNMSRIADLTFKIGKLDRIFTRTGENEKLDLVTESSVHMMKAMNMKIVVEGVETREMLDRFTSLGCDYIQVYYFSRPLPEDEFVKFILENQMVS